MTAFINWSQHRRRIRDQSIGSFAAFLQDETPSVISMRFPFDGLVGHGVMSEKNNRSLSS
jgi:hypothetical protein